MSKYDVITFGSATIDLFAETNSERVVQMCEGDRCENFLAYRSGDKVLVSELHVDIGGGGTNTAASLAKLGCKTAYGGCIGKDAHGNDILAWLEKNNIDFVGSRVDAQTNASIVLDSKTLHDRAILAFKDASNKLSIQDLDLDKLQSTWFYFPSMVGASFQAMLALMRKARERGIAIVFNPSIYQAEQGLDILREALTLSQLFVLNKEEAEKLVGLGTRDELCKRLREEGGEIIIVTDGPQGATLLYGDMLYAARPKKVKVVETTGSGDCFAASFLAGLIKGKSPEESLRLAFLNVESIIQHVGPKNGLLEEERAFAQLKKDDRPVLKEKA